ncbi:MAG: 5'-3' exonuclease H3TH domain-containing protein, partial [Rikenellaceae bacterium]
MEKLFLIDAYALIFKFYYAFLSRPMRNNDGLNTSAIFGFTKFINDIISKEQPQHLGVAFDMAGGNFRHELYPLYKANRDETPPDIIASTPHIKRILKAMRIPILEMQGFEADDIIGTIAKKAACNDFEVFMVTPDKDYGQLIDCCINMYKPSKSGSGIEIVDKAKIKEIYGVDDPTLIIDILALWGDASDNIPGVPGIGEKTAVKLVNEYGTVENIIKNVHLIKGKNGDNIRAGVDQLLLSKKLATIDLNVPIAYEPSKLLMEQPDYKELRNLYKEMNFGSLISTIDFWERCNSSVNATYSDELPIIAGQTDLFNQEP